MLVVFPFRCFPTPSLGISIVVGAANHSAPFSVHLANISISAAGTFVYERLPNVPQLLRPDHPFTRLRAIELFHGPCTSSSLSQIMHDWEHKLR